MCHPGSLCCAAGSSFLLPASSLSLDYADERTSPDDSAVLEATAMLSTPSPSGPPRPACRDACRAQALPGQSLGADAG